MDSTFMEFRHGRFKHYDYLEEDDDSDQGATDSSEDEIDIILHGTRDQKRRLSRSTSGAESSESDFEREMRQELDEKVEALEKARKTPDREGICQSTSGSSSVRPSQPDTGQGSSGKQKYYDDVYFDSDEEEMVMSGDERTKRKKRKHKILSNDNLLYDPDMDDEDQEWVDKHRRSYQPKRQGNKPSKLPKSDAVLDCPACMTTLCLDCQKHDLYHNQFRAMFVMNCQVDKTELLKHPEPHQKKRKKKGKRKHTQNTEDIGTSSSVNNETVNSDPSSCARNDAVSDTNAGELSDKKLHPVRCTECNTVVAVMDHEEVYHFFNVLASH